MEGNPSHVVEVQPAAGGSVPRPAFERRSGGDRRGSGRRASDAAPDAAPDETQTDPATGLCGVDAWGRMLAAEDERCGRYGHASCVFAVELDGAGASNEKLICLAGQSMRAVIKERDIVARTGTGKFAVLIAECNIANSRRVLQRIRMALDRAGVTASLGLAVRLPEKGLHYAWREADRAKHYRVP